MYGEYEVQGNDEQAGDILVRYQRRSKVPLERMIRTIGVPLRERGLARSMSSEMRMTKKAA